MYTTSSAFLDALTEAGISCIFANFGSDHPAMVEAIAQARSEGRSIPRIFTCPNEMVGMSAAHGFWQASGIPQAVVVHVECGTQALAGAVHNAAKGRAPMLIFAGASPFTQDGEMTGSRNEFIQWIQDVHDQRGIVRGYVKYDNEIRSGHNVKHLVHRALQFAGTDPKGPSYLMGAREVMEAAVEPRANDIDRHQPLIPSALSPEGVETIGRALLAARRPLVVTTYIGRNPDAVEPLTALCHRLGIGVLESVPTWMNYPHDDSFYLGNQWNEPVQNAALAEADMILVLDSDVPWIPTVNRPARDAKIYHIDVDPLKQQMPLADIPALAAFRADAATCLAQLHAWLDTQSVEQDALNERTEHYRRLHDQRADILMAREASEDGKPLTSEYFLSRLRRHVDETTLIVNEGISNYQAIFNHLAPTRPASMFTSGGGSLGWHGGAAIGIKLAQPDKTVIALTGDGSFMFSVPTSVHWMARRYETPFLHIVFNNGGWKSPKLSTLAVHPSGYAAAAEDIDVSFEPAPDYVGIAAAAGGAWGKRVTLPAEVDAAIEEALTVVRDEKRSALLEIVIPPL